MRNSVRSVFCFGSTKEIDHFMIYEPTYAVDIECFRISSTEKDKEKTE